MFCRVFWDVERRRPNMAVQACRADRGWEFWGPFGWLCRGAGKYLSRSIILQFTYLYSRVDTRGRLATTDVRVGGLHNPPLRQHLSNLYDNAQSRSPFQHTVPLRHRRSTLHAPHGSPDTAHAPDETRPICSRCGRMMINVAIRLRA